MSIKSTALLFLLFFLIAANCDGQKDSLSSWQQLKVERFSIYHPKELNVDTSGRMATIFILKAPLEDSSDQFMENFNLIGVNNVFNDFSIREWGEANVKSLTSYLSNVKVIWEDTISFSREIIYKAIYDFQSGLYDLRAIQYYFKREESFFILTFVSEKKAFGKYEEFALKLMSTFSIASD